MILKRGNKNFSYSSRHLWYYHIAAIIVMQFKVEWSPSPCFWRNLFSLLLRKDSLRWPKADRTKPETCLTHGGRVDVKHIIKLAFNIQKHSTRRTHSSLTLHRLLFGGRQVDFWQSAVDRTNAFVLCAWWLELPMEQSGKSSQILPFWYYAACLVVSWSSLPHPPPHSNAVSTATMNLFVTPTRTIHSAHCSPSYFVWEFRCFS